jgi:hypothetical protein
MNAMCHDEGRIGYLHILSEPSCWRGPQDPLIYGVSLDGLLQDGDWPRSFDRGLFRGIHSQTPRYKIRMTMATTIPMMTAAAICAGW